MDSNYDGKLKENNFKKQDMQMKPFVKIIPDNSETKLSDKISCHI